MNKIALRIQFNFGISHFFLERCALFRINSKTIFSKTNVSVLSKPLNNDQYIIMFYDGKFNIQTQNHISIAQNK